MKNLLVTVFFLVILSIPVSAQWYKDKYHVRDLNDLSIVQLTESRSAAKNGVYVSLGCLGLGSLAVLAGLYLPAEPSDDPTFLEQLIGPKGMSYLAAGIGVVFVVGGAIGTMVFSGRLIQVNSAIRRNFPEARSMRFTPGVIKDRYSGRYLPGATLTIRF